MKQRGNISLASIFNRTDFDFDCRMAALKRSATLLNEPSTETGVNAKFFCEHQVYIAFLKTRDVA